LFARHIIEHEADFLQKLKHWGVMVSVDLCISILHNANSQQISWENTMDSIERRFTDNRSSKSDRRIESDRRTTTVPTDAEHRKTASRRTGDRRSGDRRKHCMHCGTPYKVELTGIRACTCRVKALQGSM
jgi:hypothetical protein